MLTTDSFCFIFEGASEFKFDPSQIKKFKNLLMKYIDSDKNKELQALFAAQLLAEDLKHPKGKYIVYCLFVSGPA